MIILTLRIYVNIELVTKFLRSYHQCCCEGHRSCFSRRKKLIPVGQISSLYKWNVDQYFSSICWWSAYPLSITPLAQLCFLRLRETLSAYVGKQTWNYPDPMFYRYLFTVPSQCNRFLALLVTVPCGTPGFVAIVLVHSRFAHRHARYVSASLWVAYRQLVVGSNSFVAVSLLEWRLLSSLPHFLSETSFPGKWRVRADVTEPLCVVISIESTSAITPRRALWFACFVGNTSLVIQAPLWICLVWDIRKM